MLVFSIGFTRIFPSSETTELIYCVISHYDFHLATIYVCEHIFAEYTRHAERYVRRENNVKENVLSKRKKQDKIINIPKTNMKMFYVSILMKQRKAENGDEHSLALILKNQEKEITRFQRRFNYLQQFLIALGITYADSF